MKAILEFNLPEDRHEYQLTTKALDLYLSLDDIRNKIRAFNKYELGVDPPEDEKYFREWSDKISKLVHEIWQISINSTNEIE